MYAMLLLLVALSSSAQSGAAGPVESVASVDLDRYVGEWFEIARFPNRFQDDCAGDVTATYATRPDGRLDVVNRCHGTDGNAIEARGVARVVDGTGASQLKVRFAPGWLSFLPFVWGDYWILGLDSGYQWAVVGSPNRDYLWILARAPRMDPQVLSRAIDVARANGFDVTRLVMTPQAGES